MALLRGIAIAVTVTGGADAALAQSRGAFGVSQEIRLVARVLPRCGLRAGSGSGHGGGITLTGRTDKGEEVSIGSGGARDVRIECNTPYSMNLERVITGIPARGDDRDSGRDNGNRSEAPDRHPGRPVLASAEPYEISIELATRHSLAAGSDSVIQQCAFDASGHDAGHCQLPGAGGMDGPLSARSHARLSIVPNQGAALFDPVDLDEPALAGQIGGPMAARGAVAIASMDPGAVSAITTGSLATQPETKRRRVVREHLSLTVSGRF
jgi:hypothetical protein